MSRTAVSIASGRPRWVSTPTRRRPDAGGIGGRHLPQHRGATPPASAPVRGLLPPREAVAPTPSLRAARTRRRPTAGRRSRSPTPRVVAPRLSTRRAASAAPRPTTPPATCSPAETGDRSATSASITRSPRSPRRCPARRSPTSDAATATRSRALIAARSRVRSRSRTSRSARSFSEFGNASPTDNQIRSADGDDQIQVGRDSGGRTQQREELPIAGRAGQPAGDDPVANQPCSRAASSTCRIASRCRSGSRTTPPRPSRSRPTSNCGLIINSMTPSLRTTELNGPTSMLKEMNDTSATTRSTGRLPDLAQTQLPEIEPLVDDDPRVVAHAIVQLTAAHIDREDLRAATLQQHLGEPAGGGAGVQGASRDRQLEIRQRPEQLVRRPRHVRLGLRGEHVAVAAPVRRAAGRPFR